MNACLKAIAYALPEKILTNQELSSKYPEWDLTRLENRTGVRQRYIAKDNETALDLAEKACSILLEEFPEAMELIDGIIFCTETPDYLLPSNASLLHGRLNFDRSVLALDINMGCSGFVYCLEVANNFIKSGGAENILLVTADTYSKLINPRDRATRVLFGDGAAASLITKSEEGGIIDVVLGTDGRYFDRFMVPAGGARQKQDGQTGVEHSDRSGNFRSAEDINMDGFGVLSFFNAIIPEEVNSILEKNGISKDQVDLFVFHQASKIALDSIVKVLEIPAQKAVNEMLDTGNLVSASIPVALKKTIDKGKAKRGDLILLCGFGVGLSWGTALIRY